MERKTYTTTVLIAALVISLIMAFILPASGQTLNTDNQLNVVAAGENKTELNGGTWLLTDRRMERFNNAGVTKWSGSDQNVLGECKWVDVLNIEHSIEGGFKWGDAPRTMIPGADTKFNIEYVYDNYATTNNVAFGMKVKIDNITADYMAASPTSLDIMRISKNGRNYGSETKTAYFTAPKTFLGESNQISLLVDCYMGQDHYVATYTYTWSSEESAAK